jgi:MFS family permease
MGSMATGVASLMVWRIFEGLGFLCVVLPAPGLIRQHVNASQLRKLLGYWGAYMPAGTALTLLFGPLWLPEWGWRSWWLLFALLSWAMAFVLWRVVPADVSLTSVGIHWQQRLRETLSAPGPWWVTLCKLASGQLGSMPLRSAVPRTNSRPASEPVWRTRP